MLQPTDRHDDPVCFRVTMRRPQTIVSWGYDVYCERVCAAAPPKLNKRHKRTFKLEAQKRPNDSAARVILFNWFLTATSAKAQVPEI